MEISNKRILLNIRCTHLNIKASKIYVLVRKEQQKKMLPLGQTELVDLNQNITEIQFQKEIQCFYQENEISKLIFFIVEIFQNRMLKKLGYSYFNFNEFLQSDDCLYYTDIIDSVNKKEIGRILVQGNSIQNRNSLITLTFSGLHLMKRKKYCCSSNQLHEPELQIQNYNQIVAKVKCTKSNIIIKWPTINITSSKLNNNDQNQEFLIQIVDQSQVVSEVKATENQIRKQPTLTLHDIQNNSISLGELSVLVTSKEVYSYEEFKNAGLKFSLMIAIDFSESNFPYTNVNSLHHIGQRESGQSTYEIAQENIVQTLMNENCQNDVFFYGFGFTFLENQFSQFTQHCYPMNGNQTNPEVDVGLLQQTYQFFLQKIQFSNPTLFVPILTEAQRITNHIKSSPHNLAYLILVILTDGQIQDIDQAFGKVIELCDNPISIIIIGVGDANFDDMEKLNNNDLAYQDLDGKRASRDIVQFVKFNDYQNNSQLLSEAVLKEIPDQVESYMNDNNYKGQRTNRSQQNQNQQNFERRYVQSRDRDQNIIENLEEGEIIDESNMNTDNFEQRVFVQSQDQQLQSINEISNQKQNPRRQRTISNSNPQGKLYRINTVVPVNQNIISNQTND